MSKNLKTQDVAYRYKESPVQLSPGSQDALDRMNKAFPDFEAALQRAADRMCARIDAELLEAATKGKS